MTIVERLRARADAFDRKTGSPLEPLDREAADEIERLRAVIQDIERIAGEFGGYPEPADALLAIERMVRAALTTGKRDV